MNNVSQITLNDNKLCLNCLTATCLTEHFSHNCQHDFDANFFNATSLRSYVNEQNKDLGVKPARIFVRILIS